MKPIKLLLMSAALAMVALGPRAQANQNLGSPGIKQYLPLVFEFPTTGPKEPPFPDPTWIYWYNTPGGNTPITTDPTTGLANPTPGSNTSSLGSLKIVTPWPASGASQDVFFGCFDDGSPYDFTELADLTTYRNISFSILVQPGTALNGSGNYGAINAGFCDTSYGWQQAGSVTIPAAAAYSWQRLTVPIVQSQVGAGLNRYEPDIAFQYDNWGGYPAAGTTTTFWLANVLLYPLICCGEPLPSMTGPSPVIDGLNCIDTIATGTHNHYQVADTNDGVDGNDSFVGQASVDYRWTISEFPTQDRNWQAHFFIVNGSDANTSTTGVIPNQNDQQADYNMANCIFLVVQSDGAGNGIMALRYKTNEPAGNSQIWNTLQLSDPLNTNSWAPMPALTLTNSGLTGTWGLTIAGDTFTLVGPNNTASIMLPSATVAMFGEGNGPSTFLLGAQPNGITEGGESVVYSSFSRTGNHSFTDNFATDPALNTANWENLSSDLNGLVLVPPTAAYWIDWTLPAPGYAPVVSPCSVSPVAWTALTPIAQIAANGEEWALIDSNSLPAGGCGEFAVVQRAFSKLVVVLPGQTFNPGVGVTGTPTKVEGGSGGFAAETPIYVYAVDAGFYPVPGISDAIEVLSSTDGTATLPPNAENMAPAAGNPEESVAIFSSGNAFHFGQDGTFTITAEDVAPGSMIPNATSASVIVGN